MTKHKILIVDDDPKIVELLRLYLEKDGYAVLTADGGLKALDLARQRQPDLILLDLMLPEMDGLDVCRILQTESEMPIIMLTARTTDEDKLIGLELGADDYVTKPFSPREVVARVRAVLRRAEGDFQTESIIRSGDLVIDLTRRSVTLSGEPVSLTPTEFDLLAVLARHPGRPFTRAQLISRIYDVAYDGYDRAIDSHVKNLRSKIEPHTPDASQFRYILTVYGVGYKFSEAE